MQVGLEVLLRKPELTKGWGRCGLLCNQASVTKDFLPAWTAIHELLGKRLTALFGPQHGFSGTVQDNMIETGHATHRATGLPVFSLYSETREPTQAMLSHIDTLIIDLQIVGCRIYTWKSTIAGCLRAAKAHGKKVVILDRPNPVGGEVVEGRVLDKDTYSFVGQFPIPMRHALTAAEAAIFANLDISADLEWVKLEGWNPKSYWGDLGRPWVLTSPNLPTIDPVYVYPGTVILEGTNLSEGRGTGLPFQFIGAPYISDAEAYKARILEYLGGDAPGVYLRPASFQPTSQKWQGEHANGIQLHVTNPSLVRSYRLTLAIIQAAMDLGQGKFAWKDPPYEYDYETLPIKLIIGSKKVTDYFGSSKFDPHHSFWSDGITSYIKEAEKILLYPRTLKLD